MKRRIRIVAIILSILLLLPQLVSGSNSESKVKILLAGNGFSNVINVPGYEDVTQNVGDYLYAIANEFMSENTDIEVEVLINNAASGTTETLDVEIASGNIPNLFFSKVSDHSKYMGMGMIESLDKYFSDEEISDFIGGAMTNTNEWRVPVCNTPKLLCINKTIFEKAGALELLPSSEDRNWTTDEYLNALRAVNDPKNGIYATILFAKTQSAGESMMGYYWPYGARMFDDADLSKTIFNSECSARALTFKKNDLLDAGLTVPAPTALTDDDMWAMFENGALAVAPEAPLFEEMARTAGFEVYFVNYPHPSDMDPGPLWMFTYALTVWKSDNQEEIDASVKLAKFITDKWGVAIGRSVGALPVRHSQIEDFELSNELQAVVNLVAEQGTIDTGTALPQYPLLRETFKDMEAYVFTNQKTPTEALEWFEKTMNDILSN